jgi:uncharacterized repeat protein (TIGR03803 family)
MQRNSKHDTVTMSRVLYIALIALVLTANAWAGEKVLLRFNGTDGEHPWGNLIAGKEGNLYGVTAAGGIDCAQNSGCGLVFRLSKVSGVWKETVLHKFTGGNDGYLPNSLVLDSASNIYGTTMNGGGRGGSCNQGTACGVVFQLTPTATGTWPEKILYRFGGGNGVGPDALAFDSQGNLYGTTRNGGGGSPICVPTGGCGVLFKLTPTASVPWTLTAVHVFPYNSSDDPGLPMGLAIGAGDVIYVTTDNSIVQFTPGTSGWTSSVIHSFNGNGDGLFPSGAAILDAAGNLYGATGQGGSLNRGIVYELSPGSGGGWTESILYSFGTGSDGRGADSQLAFDGAGNLYGATMYGGGTAGKCPPVGCGIIFELTPSSSVPWPESLPVRFGGTNGVHPAGGLVLNTDGNLYGTASQGGATFDGVLFEVTP